MDTEPVAFDGLILVHTWWAYAIAIALWSVMVACYLGSEARYQIRGYLLQPWRWGLTRGQKWRALTAAIISAAICAGVTYGLLSWRQAHRRSTYASALEDWARYLASQQTPEDSCLVRLTSAAGKNRAKAFVDVGIAICNAFPELSRRDKFAKQEIRDASTCPSTAVPVFATL